MDSVSQVTANARDMEKVYYAVAVGLSKSPALVEFLSQTLQSFPQSPRFRRLAQTGTQDLGDADRIPSPGRIPTTIPETAWTYMENLDLEAELRRPCRTVREPPRWFRGSLQKAFGIGLQQWDRYRTNAAWKLIVLTPKMLLRPTAANGDDGKNEFNNRMRRFLQGDWEGLLQEASEPSAPPRKQQRKNHPTSEDTRRRQQAVGKIKLREISRARILLTSTGLAPGTSATLNELTNEELRPRIITEEIPEDVLSFQPILPFRLDRHHLLQAMRSAGRGSAPDLAGMRYEHLRVLLEDEDLWSIFGRFAEAFARAEVPPAVAAALRLGRMTALLKDTG